MKSENIGCRIEIVRRRSPPVYKQRTNDMAISFR